MCFMEGRVLKEWQRAVIVLFYMGRSDMMEFKNYMGISLLSISGKVYGKVLIERVHEMTERLTGKYQCDFRMRRGCVAKVCVMKQISKNCITKGKSLHVAYMDLKKAYDRVDRTAVLRVLNMYGVKGMLLNAIYAE